MSQHNATLRTCLGSARLTILATMLGSCSKGPLCPPYAPLPALECAFNPGISTLGGEPVADGVLTMEGDKLTIEYAREDGTTVRVTYRVHG